MSHVFISGAMGAGKSSVARELGRKLGRRAIDLDALIAERAGLSVREIFETRGEAAFRVLEREVALAVCGLEEDAIVALGGGTVTDGEVRRALLRAGTLVTLRAPASKLAERLAGATDRPLLDGVDPETHLQRLLEQRADAYAECHAEIDTDGRSLESLVEEVRRVAEDAPVVVPLGLRTYRVEIGNGVRGRLGVRARAAARGQAVCLVTDRNVRPRWAQPLQESLASAGWCVAVVELEPGEEHKTIRGVEAVWDAAVKAPLDREGLMLGVGGGVVGDLTGFAASTWLRGVALGQVPTTLLAMVDSSVGGKTGFDRSEGKNLVGTFYQPRFVLCDIEVLETLPERERRAGLAEVVKSAWLAGESAVAGLEREAGALAAGDAAATERAVRMAVSLKAEVVTEDERESGKRMLLNLGHTVGHAIEAASGYRGLLHGEAVALGMVAAFRVARARGKEGARDQGVRLERLLCDLGFSTDLDAHLGPQIERFLATDKKRRGARVHFVVPGVPGATEITPLELSELPGLLR